jgi:hypothetical protein
VHVAAAIGTSPQLVVARTGLACMGIVEPILERDQRAYVSGFELGRMPSSTSAKGLTSP